MATVNIINKLPQTLDNLIVTSTIGGVNLDWDSPRLDEFWQTEIWASSTNDRSAAALVTTTVGTSFYHQLVADTTKYYWILTKDRFGNNNGAWHPLSSSAGVTNTSDLVVTTDVTVDAITDTTIVSSSTPTSFVNSEYGEIENLLSTNYTGEGFSTEFFYTSDYSSDSRLTGVGVINITQLYTLTNTSSGGAEATSTAPVFGTSAVYNDGNDASWSNLSNAGTADASYATITNTGTGLEYASFYNFDFASIIPANSTLIDIELIVKCYASGGTGTPAIVCTLNWDGADLPTTAVNKYAAHWYGIDLTGTNTEYTRGYNNPFVADSKTNNCKHWTASWRSYADDTSADGVYTYLPLDMSYITDSNFGVTIVPGGSYTSGTYYIDYVGVKIRYTTEDVIYQSVQYINDNLGNDDYVEVKNGNPSNRILSTLVDGDTYNYRVDHIRHLDDAVTSGGIVGTSLNRVLSIREFKR